MALNHDRSIAYWSGQNVRPPLGSWFNGQSYWIKVHPELGRSDRSVLVVKMIRQFQFSDGDGGSRTMVEKNVFAHNVVDSVVAVCSEKHRLLTTSNVPVAVLRDLGVVLDLPYFIDGVHLDDDFEIEVTKHAELTQ